MEKDQRPYGNGGARSPVEPRRPVSGRDDGRATGEARLEKVLEELEPAEHRRVLTLLNEAVAPEELMYRRDLATDGTDPRARRAHALSPSRTKRPLMSKDAARAVIELRNKEFPLGFRHIRETLAAKGFSLQDLIKLLQALSKLLYGTWTVFPQPIPRRGTGEDFDGVVHAALLHTGKVLFITADETTLLWDPQNTTAATFESPVNQPQMTPPGEGYSVLCGGHCFLANGQLLVVGGGGYGPHHLARWGYRFDAIAKTWTRTAGPMSEHRWYPTALRLGDYRVGASREVLVVCGHGEGDMEIYDEASDTFRQIDGDTKRFPRLYPGLHLLPNHAVFYTRTGWGSAGPNSPQGDLFEDDQSAYFTMSSPDAGGWTNTAPTGATKPDRTKGMSVMLLSRDAPYVRVLVLGGADPANNDTYEIIDASALSTTVNWGPAHAFPDHEHRSLGSAVLLPDGTVFVAGGIQRTNSPCAIFDPRTNQWSGAAALASVRDYHSVAFLLPSAEVAMAGWNNTSIEVFQPPYLYRGARPTITGAPAQVRHGESFRVDTPDSASIRKVVFIRPMAVTHQTDTEQRVIELSFDQSGVSGLVATAPDGGPPYSLAPQGHYMMFIVNADGVPSVASWVYLVPPDFHMWSLSQVSQATGAPPAAGNPFGYMFDSQGTQHIIYRSTDGHIRELWWDGSWHAENLTGATGAPQAAGDPGGYMFDAQGTQHVIYRSNDGHIRELWWDGSWHAEDLTAATAAPAAASEPSGYMFDAQGTQHLIYRSADGHIRELWWDGTWHAEDLTGATGAPAATGNPHAYMFDAQGTQHVVFRSADGHIRELWWDGAWHAEDLTGATGVAAAAGDPCGYMFNAQGTQHVIFRSTDGHIRELWWDGAWHAEDLTAASGAPNAASDPSAYMFDAQGTQHVVFRSADNHIRELWWDGTWHAEDLTAATGAPPASGKPHGYMFDAQGSQHVIYRGTDGNVHELWWV
ncbi:MAG: DUF1929 domain-containing protein [Polyangiaceae bacterium]|nr:DUF1929 domain-containing protein [Polyangiaceae bacterium]